MFGQDQKGTYYPSIEEMWQIQLHNKQTDLKIVDRVGSVESWYRKANQYWLQSEASYNGVLGGYAEFSKLDIKFSLAFIISVVQQRPTFNRISVIDCGAGIGRISKELLCQTFKTVDLIDQCAKLIDKARQILKDKKSIRHFYVKGLQQFQFEETYDCVWVQWVFSHLHDQHAIQFLRRAQKALNQGGIIVLKQNHCKIGFVVDKQDFSVTRSTELYKKLFVQAGLTILKEQTQKDWPEYLFGVRIYALY